MEEKKSFNSCFDFELGLKNTQIWKSIREDNEVSAIAKLPIIYSSVIYRNRPTPGRECVLKLTQNNLLYFCEGLNERITGIMKLGFQKLEYYQSTIDEERWFIIRIFEGPNETKIYNKCVKEANHWISILSKKLVNRNFQEKYEIVEVIGSGGFSKVYRVKELKTGKHYAAKVIKHKTILSDRRGVRLMKQEIEIMRRLDHQNIVKLHEVQEISNGVVLVMEIIEGKELYEIRGKLSLNDLLTIMKVMLEVGRYLEEIGLVHRDIKLKNIIVVDGEKLSPCNIKLIDFGMACYVNRQPIMPKCGTPGFIAPEVLKQSAKLPIPIMPNIDSYSIGVVLYEMLFRSHPFNLRTEEDSNKIARLLKLNQENDIDFTRDSPFTGFKPIFEKLIAVNKLMVDSDPKTRLTSREVLEHESWISLTSSKYNYSKTLEENTNVNSAFGGLTINPILFKKMSSGSPDDREQDEEEYLLNDDYAELIEDDGVDPEANTKRCGSLSPKRRKELLSNHCDSLRGSITESAFVFDFRHKGTGGESPISDLKIMKRISLSNMRTEAQISDFSPIRGPSNFTCERRDQPSKEEFPRPLTRFCTKMSSPNKPMSPSTQIIKPLQQV